MSGQSHLHLGLWAEVGKQRKTTTDCVQKGAEWNGSVALMEWRDQDIEYVFYFCFLSMTFRLYHCSLRLA